MLHAIWLGEITIRHGHVHWDTHGNILALETSDGKTLWHSGTGAPMQTSPITYELDGRQYVVTGSGGVMFAWALP
jgi:alcohol dehydrogenase (cytochrome c)